MRCGLLLLLLLAGCQGAQGFNELCLKHCQGSATARQGLLTTECICHGPQAPQPDGGRR